MKPCACDATDKREGPARIFIRPTFFFGREGRSGAHPLVCGAVGLAFLMTAQFLLTA